MAKKAGLAGTRAVVTSRELERSLRRLGVREGGVLLVHASLAPLGYVVHGVDAVRLVLREVLGPEGTLLVPTFTGERTDPSCWVDPALPATLWDQVREATPRSIRAARCHGRWVSSRLRWRWTPTPRARPTRW